MRLLPDGSRRALTVRPWASDEAALVLDAGEGPRWKLARRAVGRLAATPEFYLHDADVVEVGDA